MDERLLTDEEIKQVIYSDKRRVVGWTTYTSPRDRIIAKAQDAKTASIKDVECQAKIREMRKLTIERVGEISDIIRSKRFGKEAK